ncbi:PD-(D/E)XK motif protein [Pseudomonas sp. B21-017]|uniref:PD-(D/E)XK motif protein n=1 Tax=Pseudomonas sp. B21-017 TaxID=2895474 RepID=UPI0021608AE8|nr:PD-(D/E)XK motif protein [Pseudomonas sp. B21-017]UVM40087.1 PD-(D/E)XK motif protein [Pseudomonas sp. B21-017]
MKMSMTKCLSIWQSLKPESPQSVFKRYDATHPLDFYLGLDGDGRHLLLFVCSEEPPHQLDMRAIKLKKSRRDDGRWALLWTLEDLALLEMFSLLSEDLIEHSRNTEGKISPLNFVLRRLSSWRHLLERASDNILPMSSVRGLCGELVFLEELIDRLGSSEGVMSWVGPSGADQDFQFGTAAWEVKTIRPDADTLIIASERQLDSVDKKIQLIVVEIADVSSNSDGMFTLNSQISKLRKKLSSCYDALLEFDNKLLVAGYVVREEYGVAFFKLRSLASFAIVENFPYIGKKNIPAGVVNICYEIELKELEYFLIERTSF